MAGPSVPDVHVVDPVEPVSAGAAPEPTDEVLVEEELLVEEISIDGMCGVY